jgi:hypothetical protein
VRSPRAMRVMLPTEEIPLSRDTATELANRLPVVVRRAIRRVEATV